MLERGMPCSAARRMTAAWDSRPSANGAAEGGGAAGRSIANGAVMARGRAIFVERSRNRHRRD